MTTPFSGGAIAGGGFSFGASKPATGGAFGAFTGFGGGAAAATTTAKPPPAAPASTGGFSFNLGGDKITPAATAAPASSGFAFNLGQKAPQTGGFSFKPTEPAKAATTAITESKKESDEPEQNENEPYFEPIVKLDEVEVKTGEEDDEVLFVSRAKLYRFVGDEWKERGLGDMKLLRNGATGRARVLMRRENIHKLCANHFILGWMSMSKMAGKENTRIWVAFDDTMDDDTEPTKQQFCVRFKEADTAAEFEKVFLFQISTFKNCLGFHGK